MVSYRSGSGEEGNVGRDRLKILKKAVSGIRSVTNPVSATGAADAATHADVKVQAPLAVYSLDRIVSRHDYEKFAISFPGIGKVQAVVTSLEQYSTVLVSAATTDGDSIELNYELKKSLTAAMNAARFDAAGLIVGGYDAIFFNVSAEITVVPEEDSATVLAMVRDTLLDAFSFKKRAFAMGVTCSEVSNAILHVDGVAAVELNQLFRDGETEGKSDIHANGVGFNPDVGYQGAQLLLVNPDNEKGIVLTTMRHHE